MDPFFSIPNNSVAKLLNFSPVSLGSFILRNLVLKENSHYQGQICYKEQVIEILLSYLGLSCPKRRSKKEIPEEGILPIFKEE